MKSASLHRVILDRRELLAAAALSAVVAADAGPSLPIVAGLGSFETVPLWPETPPGGPGPNLATRMVERSSDPAKFHLRAISGVVRPAFSVVRAPTPNGSAVLIIPGGGYRELTIDGWRDGASVPLEDATRAMRLLHAGAAQYDVDPARIGALGFSAGGHLAALLSLRSETGLYAPVDAADRESARPLFAALLYPVITMLPPYAHEASREMLLGDKPTLAQRAAWSCERLVARGARPMFLAAAADDPDVPVENTLEMFAALRRAKIPAEMHVFERGGHGFGLGNPGEPLSAWPGLLLAWLQQFQLR